MRLAIFRKPMILLIGLAGVGRSQRTRPTSKCLHTTALRATV
jgi:hypothetical protein